MPTTKHCPVCRQVIPTMPPDAGMVHVCENCGRELTWHGPPDGWVCHVIAGLPFDRGAQAAIYETIRIALAGHADAMRRLFKCRLDIEEFAVRAAKQRDETRNSTGRLECQVLHDRITLSDSRDTRMYFR